MSRNLLGNRDLIRAFNRSTVLNNIKTAGSIARTDLARSTGLSPATITGITAELIEDGLVIEKASGNSRGGRRPILLALNPRGGYVVGIKLADQMVIGALTDLEATILQKNSLVLEDHKVDTVCQTIAQIVTQLSHQASIPQGSLLGVGIGLAGIIDSSSGLLRHSPIFGWRNIPLIELLSGLLKVPIYLDNDVNTLTLTERLFGSGQGVDHFLTVTVGRGVGLGIVVNGQLYRGARGGAGEFGHTIIDSTGPACECGKQGCLETFVSDPAMMRMAAEAYSSGELPAPVSSITDLLELAQQGVPPAVAIFETAGEKLGQAIANLINIFNPQEVILSGEGLRAGSLLINAVRASINRHTMSGLAEDTQLRIDEWEDDAWARGAASLVLLELFKSPLHPERKELSS